MLVLIGGRTLNYHIEFNKTIARDNDSWSDVLNATADESATFITATGSFVNGHYTELRVVWARRVNCTSSTSGLACDEPSS